MSVSQNSVSESPLMNGATTNGVAVSRPFAMPPTSNGTVGAGGDGDSDHGEVAASSEPYFVPIVTLPEVRVPTAEEDEEVVMVVRAKLYRFDASDTPAEWKERGTGDVKLLRHAGNKTVRLVMRRDKTLKVCANHFIVPTMELRKAAGTASEKSFVYSVVADFSDEAIKSYCLAIRFANADIALNFRKQFEAAREYVRTECKLYNGAPLDDDAVSGESDDDDDENSTTTSAATPSDDKSAASPQHAPAPSENKTSDVGEAGDESKSESQAGVTDADVITAKIDVLKVDD